MHHFISPREKCQLLLTDIFQHFPKQCWVPLLPKDDTNHNIGTIFGIRINDINALLINAGVCNIHSRWGISLNEKEWERMQVNLPQSVVVGTIRRVVYVSNTRPELYKDPADQIRAKARFPCRNLPLPVDVLANVKASAIWFDTTQDCKQQQQQQQKVGDKPKLPKRDDKEKQKKKRVVDNSVDSPLKNNNEKKHKAHPVIDSIISDYVAAKFDQEQVIT
eukprot:scaffold36049_cov20-Cyclotella_meneghiniana.AAC.1